MNDAEIFESARGFSIHLGGQVFPATPRAHEIAALLELFAVEHITWRFLRDPEDEAVQYEVVQMVRAVGMYRQRLRQLREPLSRETARAA